MKTPDIIPYGASEKRRILRTARESGVLPYDQLDRLLVDACARPEAMASLQRSLQRVRIVDSTDADLLHVELAFGGLQGRSDRDEFRAYADAVRSVPRMTRSEEHQLARRLEFARERVRGVLDALELPEAIRERLVDRGLNCDAMPEDIEDFDDETSAERIARLCEGADETTRTSFAEYARLRRYFVERNLYLVVGMAAAYRTYGLPMMDLIQEGNASLIRAVEKFDWRKDVRFQTYAAFWVRQAIERLITANRGIVRVPNYVQQKMRRLRREGKLPRNHKDVDVKDVSELFDTDVQGATRLMETDRGWFSLDLPMGREDGEGSYAGTLPAEESDDDITQAEKRALGRRLDEVMGQTLTETERDILVQRFGLGGQRPRTLDEIGAELSVSRERIRQMQIRALEKLQRKGAVATLADYL